MCSGSIQKWSLTSPGESGKTYRGGDIWAGFTRLLGFHWIVREKNGVLGRGSIMCSETCKYTTCLGEMAKNVLKLKCKTEWRENTNKIDKAAYD